MRNPWNQFLKAHKGSGLNMTQLSAMYEQRGGGDEIERELYPYALTLRDGTDLATFNIMYVGDKAFMEHIAEHDVLTGTEFETVFLMHYLAEHYPDIGEKADQAELITYGPDGKPGEPHMYVLQSTADPKSIDSHWVYVLPA